jgi:hypothetical protein
VDLTFGAAEKLLVLVCQELLEKPSLAPSSA